MTPSTTSSSSSTTSRSSRSNIRRKKSGPRLPWWLILLFLLLAAGLLVPWLQGESPFELGLDLAGGVRVTYRVDLAQAHSSTAGLADHDFTDHELTALAKETLAGRLRRQFDTLPDIAVRGDGRLVVSLPGEHDQREVLETVGKTYRMSFRPALAVHADKPDAPKGLLLPHEGRWLDLGDEVLSGDMLDPRSIRVETGQGALEDLGRGAAISFQFSPPYDERFAELTASMQGKTLAILLDDQVEWAGTVEGEIRGPGTLRGGYDLEEASQIAGMLRSGNLPVPLHVEGLSGVGAGLGQSILDGGVRSLLWSSGLLALLLVAAYLRKPALWLTACVSLASILFCIAGLVSGLGLTVDMVAIAGLVLSVGMGMDAFILIFEALEGSGDDDETAKGRSPLGRLKATYGFGGEGRTLLHANATTALVVLLLFASERLQSFATFLLVGLTASLLTIYVTRTLLESAARRGKLEHDARASGLLAPLRRSRPRLFRFRWVYAVVLGLFLIGSGAGFIERGSWLALGSEFQPGMQVGVMLDAEPASGSAELGRGIDTLLDVLEADFDGLVAKARSWSPGEDVLSRTQTEGEAYLLSLSGPAWNDGQWGTVPAGDADDLAAMDFGITPQGLAKVLDGQGAEILEMHSVDSQLSARRTLGSLSVLFGSFLLLGFYLAWVQPRLDAWGSGGDVVVSSSLGRRVLVGTVAAVILDLTVVLTVLGLLRLPLDMAVVAALLTIVGYSVNDSMVLWSRLSRPGRGAPSTEDVEREVDRVLSRAVLTSLSTMIPAAVILWIGVDPLIGFAWTVLVGTAAGTLSSLFVVASFALPRKARPAETQDEPLARAA